MPPKEKWWFLGTILHNHWDLILDSHENQVPKIENRELSMRENQESNEFVAWLISKIIIKVECTKGKPEEWQ